MAEVEVISTCLVGATAERPAAVARVDLTPWDLQFLPIGPIQKGLLFHKPIPHQQQQLFKSKFILHLKTSLSSTLDFFPPLAGRLASETTSNDGENDNNISTVVFVECNNAGVEFVEAKAAGLTVAAILDPSNDDVSKIIRSFFPLNSTRNSDGIYKPLLGVQVTELLDGYFIGCTLNHALADGGSFWNFFRSWSELSRDCRRQISKTPILERWFPDNTTCPIRLPPSPLDVSAFTPPPSLPETVFRLSKENIAKLKNRANSEMGVTENPISSLMSHLAHLWRSVTRARNLRSDEDVHIMIIVGARPRMSLPEGYWGNAAFFEVVTEKAGEVLEKGLGWAAWRMKEAVQKYTKEEIVNRYMSWVKSPVLHRMKSFPANMLGISSSPRFDVYGTDFGWGKPVAVRSGMANKIEGKVTLFAGPEEGSVDMELCLHHGTLMALKNDPEFLEYVTIHHEK
ncbi:unnamed protein product [Cuscuta europaea]|uniref:HXXXD-type acyl-transferase family protein n=1 Tax=Cuscuta europaea TaxID=41803 RepID=A0A9P1E9N3_CUSEU|nr:unnamed protein product [Cuscuta europaea]